MEKAPTHLDLFSGIGGFALAAQWAGFRTIGFCEIDKYCQKVLAKNFRAILCDSDSNGKPDLSVNAEESGLRDVGNSQSEQDRRIQQPQLSSNAGTGSPIFGNIFDLDGTRFRGVSLLTGGFPCQPFSVAGKRRGAADDRAIWPQMFRVINEARPAWVLGENVPGLIPMELDNMLSDLEGIGYAVRAFVIPACAVDARHRRDRLWIVANANGQGSQGRNSQELRERAGERVTGPSGSSICHTAIAGLSDRSDLSMGVTGGLLAQSQRPSGKCCEWLAEPDVGRVANGIPKRVDRLKGLGNAIVPQVAYEILREIRKLIQP